MKKIKWTILLLAVFLMATCLVCVPFFGEDAERTGIGFAAQDLYRTNKELSAIPHTWEAWIKVEKNAGSGRLGVIMGNYNAGAVSMNVEIRPNGQPGFWWSDGSSNTNTIFDKIDLRTGEWVFLTVTNTNNELKCYVNGELKQTKSVNLVKIDDNKMNILCLGGDLRSGNEQNLKQTLLSS